MPSPPGPQDVAAALERYFAQHSRSFTLMLRDQQASAQPFAGGGSDSTLTGLPTGLTGAALDSVQPVHTATLPAPRSESGARPHAGAQRSLPTTIGSHCLGDGRHSIRLYDVNTHACQAVIPAAIQHLLHPHPPRFRLLWQARRGWWCRACAARTGSAAWPPCASPWRCLVRPPQAPARPSPPGLGCKAGPPPGPPCLPEAECVVPGFHAARTWRS